GLGRVRGLGGAVAVGGLVSFTLTVTESSSYWPNRSMTLNTYDVWLLDDGVLTGCSSCIFIRFPTDGPVRLPLNHPNDTMLLSGSKLREPSSWATPPPVKLHSTTCS